MGKVQILKNIFNIIIHILKQDTTIKRGRSNETRQPPHNYIQDNGIPLHTAKE